MKSNKLDKKDIEELRKKKDKQIKDNKIIKK